MSRVKILVDGIEHTIDKEDFLILMMGSAEYFNRKFYKDMKSASSKVNELMEEDNRLATLADDLRNVVSDSLRDRYY